MATNDFIYDLIDKLKDDKIEFLVVYLQKGKSDHVANAHYNVTTDEGAEMLAVTLETVYDDLGKDFKSFNIDEQDVEGTEFNQDDEDNFNEDENDS